MAQQYLGSHSLHSEWWPALCDGLDHAGAQALKESDLTFAFYGNLFRSRGSMLITDPHYDAGDVEAWEAELLQVWWREASRVDPQVPSPEARTMLRTPQIVQRGLDALSNSRFFGKLSERAMIFALKQVHRYINDDAIKAAAQASVTSVVQADTRVIIGYSLGSIVAYEALCAHPELPVKRFVTIGSPLGISNLIFERLRPHPENGVGTWPSGITKWINIADAGDIVALVKALSPRFGPSVEDYLVHNGVEAHDVKRYLTAPETGRAIAGGL